ncbi:uncharacterized protein LOC131320990 isoform X1 [Rhododendron vialii]|uniref:uncharacterized protein LOC131320990 isoform X1 n=1 Tax=Rhododendron vialii TaxID=182163 RepID=UPI002660344D|nr:uncharacterized protein LOC131320990 isoform X1 [Rhododendron vialii]
MEIDKAIRESDDRRLKTKYNNAIYVIQRALALYSIEEVAFSFNGGKDSTVLLHLLRAGYFLHQAEQTQCNGDLSDREFKFPIRTIYFESSSAFPEINSFTYETASTYGLQLDILRQDFKSGLEALLKAKPIRAIFLGVRIGDPTAVGQEQFSPSSPGWPPFMRVNPILDWSYRDVWAFLLTCKVRYCSLYDQGYTSIGSIHDTVPNALLGVNNSDNSKEKFRPAYLLPDGRLERAGRAKKCSPPVSGCFSSVSNGLKSVDLHKNGMLKALVIAVGDEILFGSIADQLGPSLCRKLCSIGWTVSQIAVVRNDVDSVAEEVERRKSENDMVFIYGGVGPLHSDVTVAGVAKAFGVRVAPDEEFEEYLRHLISDKCTGDRNEMAQLPEGITELLHHEKLPVPLIKCQNVIILSATNIIELDREWDCLIELTRSSGFLALVGAFVSKHLRTTLSDVETAQPLSKLGLDFPDLSIGCYRESRYGSLVISFRGKDEARIEAAAEALRKKFHPGAFNEIN